MLFRSIGPVPRPLIEVVAKVQRPKIEFTLALPELPARKVPDEARVKRNVDVYFESFSNAKSAAFGQARIDAERTSWSHFYSLLKTLPSPPELFRPKTGTRGIVMSCAGRYFSQCLANAKILIELHQVKIPIGQSSGFFL